MSKQESIVMTTGSDYRIILVDENDNYLGKSDKNMFGVSPLAKILPTIKNWLIAKKYNELKLM